MDIVIALERHLDRRIAYGRPSEHTRRSYRAGARAFARWCAERGLAVPAVSEDDIVDYRGALIAQYKPATVRSKLQAVRVLFDALGLDPNPAADVHAPPDRTEPEETIVYLTVEQVRAVLAQAEAESHPLRQARDLAMVWLLVTSGIRNQELCDLDVDDLTLAEDAAQLVIRAGKWGKRRVLHLAPETADAVRAWLVMRPDNNNNGSALFVGTTGRGRLTPGGVRKIVNGWLTSADIKVRGKAVHLMRHTAITLAVWAGANRTQVQRMAGHKDPRTTDRYVHLIEAQRQNPGRFVEVLLSENL